MKKILEKAEWTTFSLHHPKSRSSFKEGHALCLVGLERDPVIWAFTKQRDDKFREILFPIRRIEDSNWTKTSRNSESEGRRVSSRQCAASCVFDNSTKVVGARLGCSTPFTIFIRPRALWFHLFRSLQNSLNGKSFNSLVEVKNYLEKFFAEKSERFWKNGKTATDKNCLFSYHRVLRIFSEFFINFLVLPSLLATIFPNMRNTVLQNSEKILRIL